jgi:hypothetical protein
MKNTIYLGINLEEIESLMKGKRIAVIPYGGDYRIAFKSAVGYWLLIKRECEKECGTSTRMLNFLAKKRQEAK